jgi:hypothetical protein
MPTNAMQTDRRRRLLSNILESTTDIPQDPVLAMFSLNEKVTVRKAREFMEELILARTENRLGETRYPN